MSSPRTLTWVLYLTYKINVLPVKLSRSTSRRQPFTQTTFKPKHLVYHVDVDTSIEKPQEMKTSLNNEIETTFANFTKNLDWEGVILF